MNIRRVLLPRVKYSSCQSTHMTSSLLGSRHSKPQKLKTTKNISNPKSSGEWGAFFKDPLVNREFLYNKSNTINKINDIDITYSILEPVTTIWIFVKKGQRTV